MNVSTLLVEGINVKVEAAISAVQFLATTNQTLTMKMMAIIGTDDPDYAALKCSLEQTQRIVEALDTMSADNPMPLPKFESVNSQYIKGRGLIKTVDLAANADDTKKFERLLKWSIENSDAPFLVEIDGDICTVTGVERSSANTLAGLVIGQKPKTEGL